MPDQTVRHHCTAAATAIAADRMRNLRTGQSLIYLAPHWPPSFLLIKRILPPFVLENGKFYSFFSHKLL